MTSTITHRRLRTIRTAHFILQNWLTIFIVLFGIFNLLPFLAPVAMKLGWTGIGHGIYILFAPLCHQMAQRSFFLFGEDLMYTPDQMSIKLNGTLLNDVLALKHFQGTSDLGWKVAWSDRMVYMYGATWLAAIAYSRITCQHYIKSIRLWLFALLLLPMFIDGVSHVLSEQSAGMTEGFRYYNNWLADLTGNALPPSFYVGDKLGSFNSIIRLLSGVGFSIGVVWLSFPMIDKEIYYKIRALDIKLAKYQQNDEMRQKLHELSNK